MSTLHKSRSSKSLDGRRVRLAPGIVPGADPAAVFFVTATRDPSRPVPLDDLPRLGPEAEIVPESFGAARWRRSTWAPGAARTVPASALVPVSSERATDEHTFGCAVRLRSAWSRSENRSRALNCICGADDAPRSTGDTIDPAGEEVRP